MLDVTGLDISFAEHFQRVEEINGNGWKSRRAQKRNLLALRVVTAHLLLRLAGCLDGGTVARRSGLERPLTATRTA